MVEVQAKTLGGSPTMTRNHATPVNATLVAVDAAKRHDAVLMVRVNRRATLSYFSVTVPRIAGKPEDAATPSEFVMLNPVIVCDETCPRTRGARRPLN